MIIEKLKFKAYFEQLYPLCMVDSFRTSKVHHHLPLVTIDLVGDNREFKFKAYFEELHPLWVSDSLRTSKVHHYLSLVTIGCPSNH